MCPSCLARFLNPLSPHPLLVSAGGGRLAAAQRAGPQLTPPPTHPLRRWWTPRGCAASWPTADTSTRPPSPQVVDASRLRNELAYANDVFGLPPNYCGRTIRAGVVWDAAARRPANVIRFVQPTRSRPLQARARGPRPPRGGQAGQGQGRRCRRLVPCRPPPAMPPHAAPRPHCPSSPRPPSLHATPLATPQELLLEYGDDYWHVTGPALRRAHQAFAARAARVRRARRLAGRVVLTRAGAAARHRPRSRLATATLQPPTPPPPLPARSRRPSACCTARWQRRAASPLPSWRRASRRRSWVLTAATACSASVRARRGPDWPPAAQAAAERTGVSACTAGGCKCRVP